MVAVAGALIAVLIPNHAPTGAEKVAGTEGPAQLAAAEPKGKLTKADRQAIDGVLDRFLPAGMERKDPALAWQLAGPELRSGSTLAGWRKGDTPVPFYETRETTFHNWQTIDVGPSYVIFNLLVHPKRGSKLASYVFSGEVVRHGDSWLVNRLYTIAIMNPVTRTTHEIGPADFAAPGTAAGPSSGNNSARLGKAGLLPVAGVIGLVLLIPLALGIVVLVRARRWKRQVRTAARTDMPALPSRYRSGT